jgi:di/tricarboxylate transporter
VAVERSAKLSIATDLDFELHAGDTLVIVGDPSRVERLSALSELIVEEALSATELESGEIGVFEVVPSPRSRAIGKTLVGLGFREKYGFQVLAIWRGGKPRRSLVATMPLQLGDALLVIGPRDKAHLLAEDRDFILLTADLRSPVQTNKALFAIGGLLLMLGLTIFLQLPTHVSALAGALFVILCGALTMEDAYREINWRVVILIAAMVPMGIAFDNSGAAGVLAQWLTNVLGKLGPYAALLAFGILASAVSQLLDSVVAVLLLGPVAVRVAENIGVSPYPILMTIAVATSIAFLTPFSHRVNLIVMGPGAYRKKDYLKIGLVLTVVSLLVLCVVVPIVMPLSR